MTETVAAAAAVNEPVDDEATQAAAEVAAQETAAVEGRARRMGWRPKDEFRGEPSRWTDAKSFIERGEAELPVLRERYRALDDRFAKLEERSSATERELSERLKEMSATFNEFRTFAKSADERSYQRAKVEIEAKMAAAVDTADRNAYAVARAELDAIEQGRRESTPARTEPARAEARAATVATAAPAVHPDVTTWIGDNAWFNTDPAMSQYAVAVHGQLLRDRPGMTMRENLAEVRADVMSRFPEKFGNKKREESAAVVAPITTATTTKKKGKYPDYADWPADAKAAYAKYARQMPNYTKDEYAKLYFAGDEK